MLFIKHETIKQTTKRSDTRVNFTIITKQVLQQKDIKKVQKKKSKKIIKKIIKSKPKIIKQKQIKKIVKQKYIKKVLKQKHVKKIIKQKHVKKVVKQNHIKKVVKQKHIKKVVKQKQLKRTQIKRVESKSNIGISKQDDKLKKLKMQKYFTLVKQTINENKIYPQKAVRRGIQGIIKVKFRVSKSGELLDINILSGKKIFYRSIKKAIENSFTLIPPANVFDKDFEIGIKIVYQLQG